MLLFVPTKARAQQVELPSDPKEMRQAVPRIHPTYTVNVQPMFGGSNPNIVFTMPQAAERIWNPMAIRIGSTTTHFFKKTLSDDPTLSSKGVTLWDLFKYIEDEPQKFEVIQVERVIVNPASGNDATKATLWFTYIEKQFVLPIAK
jgi:hypothetical protein